MKAPKKEAHKKKQKKKIQHTNYSTKAFIMISYYVYYYFSKHICIPDTAFQIYTPINNIKAIAFSILLTNTIPQISDWFEILCAS
jgi:uncharacterized membrane protein YozB (DUF420 family)